jgi:hypothetical protein
MSDTKDNKGEYKIIFEDDDWLIVEPFDYESYIYYAPEKMKDMWNEFHGGGDVYLIVDKLFPVDSGFKTYTILVEDEKNEFFWWNGRKIDKRKEFLDDFPKHIKNEIDNLLSPSRIYDLLFRLSSGENIPSDIIENADDLIYNIRINKSYPRKSILKIYFEDEDDYLDLFDLNDDDKWFYRMVNSYYDSYEFYDSSYGYEEWTQGYLVRWFNRENMEKFKLICNLLYPDLKDFSDEDKLSPVCKNLDDTFFEISDIYDDWVTEMNSCKNRAGLEMVNDELCGVFDLFGLMEQSCGRKYLTAVNLILSMYQQVNDKTLTLSELFKELISNKEFGGWYEYMYEIECNDFDDESFQKYTSDNLDNIYEKIEDSDQFENVVEYSRIFQEITSKYPIDTNSKTKYGKTFKVIKINPSDNKIHVAVDTGGGRGEQRSYTKEEFENFLISPELFENRKIFKKSLNIK